jgi:hypothetical protein
MSKFKLCPASGLIMDAAGFTTTSILRTISLSKPAPFCLGPFRLQQKQRFRASKHHMQCNHQLLQNDSYSYTKVRYSPPLEVPQGSKHQPITLRNHRCVYKHLHIQTAHRATFFRLSLFQRQMECYLQMNSAESNIYFI